MNDEQIRLLERAGEVGLHKCQIEVLTRTDIPTSLLMIIFEYFIKANNEMNFKESTEHADFCIDVLLHKRDIGEIKTVKMAKLVLKEMLSWKE